MFKRTLAVFLLLTVPTLAALAQSEEKPPTTYVETLDATPNAITPECSGGVRYDNAISVGYGIGDGDPGDATVVQKFDLPAGTTKLDQVCICFQRDPSIAPDMPFDVQIFNDNGSGGQPGTLVATINATATAIPVAPNFAFYQVSIPAAVTLPDTGVYIGARWRGGQTFMCGDREATTAQRSIYGSGNQGVNWFPSSTLFPTAPPKAMGIRTDPVTTGTCSPSTTAMCLNANRFRVEATWSTGSSSGTANVTKLTEDTGYLYFFSPSNVEVVIKILNGCPVNNRYWVFAGGLTDVQTTITVTDTKTGSVRQYINPQGTAFAPVQDTSAFATCP